MGLLACLSPLPGTVFAFFPGLAKSGLLPLNSCLQLWDSSMVGSGPTLSHPVLTPASPRSSEFCFTVQWAALARASSGLGYPALPEAVRTCWRMGSCLWQGLSCDLPRVFSFQR